MNTFANYNITWMYNGNPITGAPNNPEYSVNKPGEYTAVLRLELNPNNFCEAKAHLNAVPCKTYDADLVCGTLPNITLPDIQAVGVTLAAGDKFTAGDYTVVITEITSGDPAGYIGTGYVEMKLVAGIVAKKIAVDFTNLVVNECYEMASGEVVTQYDPNWGGILDVDAAIDDVKSAIDKLTDIIQNFDGSDASKKAICDGLQKVRTQVSNDTEITFEQKTNSLLSLDISLSTWNSSCYSCTASSSGRIAASNTEACPLETFKSQYEIFTTAYQTPPSYDNCTVKISDLPAIAAFKEGSLRSLTGKLPVMFGGVEPVCVKLYYAYKGTTSPKLTTARGTTSPVKWLLEDDYIKQFKPLVEAIGNLSGLFHIAAQRAINPKLQSSKELVQEFFTANNDATFDAEFWKLIQKYTNIYVKENNERYSSAIQPVYIEFDILSFGSVSTWKNLATAFSSSAFKLATNIPKATIKLKTTGKIIGTLTGSNIQKVATPTQKAKKVLQLVKEPLENSTDEVAAIVEGQLGGASIKSFSEVLEEFIPTVTTPIKSSFSKSLVTSNGKILDLPAEITIRLKEAAKTVNMSNNEFGQRVEDLISDELVKITGLKKITSVNASNNGIDILLVDDELAPTICMIFEVKGTRNVGEDISWKFGTAYQGFLQQSNGWITGVKNLIGLPTAARDVLDKYGRGEIARTIKAGVYVDGDGVTNILKLVD